MIRLAIKLLILYVAGASFLNMTNKDDSLVSLKTLAYSLGYKDSFLESMMLLFFDDSPPVKSKHPSDLVDFQKAVYSNLKKTSVNYPLKIVTAEKNSIMVLRSTDNSQKGITIFLPRFSQLTIEVPKGQYNVYLLNSSDDWLGYSKLFGDSTNYLKSKKPFSFGVPGLNWNRIYLTNGTEIEQFVAITADELRSQFKNN